MSFTDQLLGTIDARIAEAHEQIGSLEDALAALTAEAQGAEPAAVPVAAEPRPAAPAVALTAATAAPKGQVRLRRTRKLDADGLTALLEGATGGLSAASIAERANASYNQVLQLLRERELAGEVRRSGTRRSTVWRLITDEERIAARAAELAARM